MVIGDILTLLPKLADAATKLSESRDESARLQMLIEFQQAQLQIQAAALSLSAQLSGLQSENEALKKQIETNAHWDATSCSFERLQVQKGIFVQQRTGSGGKYAIREKFCEPCFSNRKLSLLQLRTVEHGRETELHCPHCKNVLRFTYFIDQSINFNPSDPFANAF